MALPPATHTPVITLECLGQPHTPPSAFASTFFWHTHTRPSLPPWHAHPRRHTIHPPVVYKRRTLIHTVYNLPTPRSPSSPQCTPRPAHAQPMGVSELPGTSSGAHNGSGIPPIYLPLLSLLSRTLPQTWCKPAVVHSGHVSCFPVKLMLACSPPNNVLADLQPRTRLARGTPGQVLGLFYPHTHTPTHPPPACAALSPFRRPLSPWPWPASWVIPALSPT